jgi:hypothetical protein
MERVGPVEEMPNAQAENATLLGQIAELEASALAAASVAAAATFARAKVTGDSSGAGGAGGGGGRCSGGDGGGGGAEISDASHASQLAVRLAESEAERVRTLAALERANHQLAEIEGRLSGCVNSDLGKPFPALVDLM